MNTKLIMDFGNIANKIKNAYVLHMWGDEYGDDYGEWISNDPSGTCDFGEGSHFAGLSEMYEVLRYKCNPKVVEAHYDYSVYHRGENGEYGINLKTFEKSWDGTNIDKWAEKYHKNMDKNRAFWASPKGKKKEEEIMKPLLAKFKEEISNLK